MVGKIECQVCKTSFEMNLGSRIFTKIINFMLLIVLTEPVDIYAQWIDKLEEANKNPEDLDDADRDDVSENSDQDDY